jgi:arabinosyltransferase C
MRSVRAESRSPVRRHRIALALAIIALIAALIGALGPAKHLRTKYSWPPRTLSAGTPSRLWYTPLLLIQHVPETLSATVPCSLPSPLPAAERPVVVLATARFPDQSGGLAVTHVRGLLVITVGDRRLDRVGLPPDTRGGDGCAYHLRLSPGRWSIEGGHQDLTHTGPLVRMPVVDGLFSALDLASGTPPSIDVTTAVHATRPVVRQRVAWTVAALTAILALLLVAVEHRPRPRAVQNLAREGTRHFRPADAAVAVVLIGWWLIAPAVYDDGWVTARENNFAASGGFSNYYASLGANHPLGYWLEWLQHWLTQMTSSLLFLRVPALLCLAATWVLCRWVLARVLPSSVGVDGTPLWALASAFGITALAWGMSLRPEPEVALLAAGVLACTVRFVKRQAAAPAAFAAVLIALALTAHPAGIVSIAPLLVIAPLLLRWARTQLVVATTIFTTALAAIAILAFVGSDFEQRRLDAELLRQFDYAGKNWRDEVTRYTELFSLTYQAPIRHGAVALMALAVLAYSFRRRREREGLLNLPGAVLAVGLLLLIATPDKWPVHFGTLVAAIAVAVAAETAHFRAGEARLGRRRALPFLALGAAVLAIQWSWAPRHSWNPFDLRTLDWTPRVEASMPFAGLAAAVPLVLFIGATLVELRNRHVESFRQVPSRGASWTAPLLVVPIITFTSVILVTDAAKTHGWTLTRQNVKALRGDFGCGLANDTFVADTGSMRSLATIQTRGARRTPNWVPLAPVGRLARYALDPASTEKDVSPWWRLPRGRDFGLFVAGTPGPTDRLELEWGRRRGGTRIVSLDATEISANFQSEVAHGIVTWRFLDSSELPPPERNASAVRITLQSDAVLGSALAVTPVSYANEPLVRRLEGRSSPSLVLPNLLMYFPCVDLPRLSDGVVAVPGQIVGFTNSWPIGTNTTPFDGLLDLYRIVRLPLTDTKKGPNGGLVYEVDQRFPGAKLAPASSITVTS